MARARSRVGGRWCPRSESNRGNELRRLVSASSGTETCGLPARNRTWTTGFVDRCSDSTETGRGVASPRDSNPRLPVESRRSWATRRGGRTTAPHPGIEPGSDRLEGDGPSVGRVGHGEPRGDQTLTRGVADRARLRESAHRADSGNRTRIVSLEDCGPTVERCPHARRAPGGSRTRTARAKSSLGKRASLHRPRETVPGASATLSSPHPVQRSREHRPRGLSRSRFTCPVLHRPAPFSGALPLGDWGGGIGETRTRIAWVQARRSPFELRSRRLRGNRTLSPSFGGSAGHHDSATYERRQVCEEAHCPQQQACLHVQLTAPWSAVMAEAVGIEPMYSSRHSPSASYGSRTRLAP